MASRFNCSLPSFYLGCFNCVDQSDFDVFCNDFVSFFINDKPRKNRFALKGFWKVNLGPGTFAFIIHCDPESGGGGNRFCCGDEEYELFRKDFLFSGNKILSSIVPVAPKVTMKVVQAINPKLLSKHFVLFNFFLADSLSVKLLHQLSTMQKINIIVSGKNRKIAKASVRDVQLSGVGEIIYNRSNPKKEKQKYFHVLIDSISDQELYSEALSKVDVSLFGLQNRENILFDWNPLRAPSAQDFGLVLPKMPACMYWKDKNLVYKWCNYNYAKALGFNSTNQIIGKKEEDLLLPEGELLYISSEDKKVMLNGCKKNFVQVRTRTDSKLIKFNASKSALYNSIGEADGVLFTASALVDDTESDLKPSVYPQDEDLDIDKSDFIIALGHDLRIPMSGILGLANSLSRSELDLKQSEIVKDIISSSKQLIMLCNSALETAELDAGMLEAQKSVFSIKKMMQDVFDFMAPAVRDKGLNLKVKYDENVFESYLGYRTILYRVLINLLSNSVQYTKDGGITLFVCSSAAEKPGYSKLTFDVSDTGKGITQDDYESMMQRFHNGVVPIISEGQVSGLGLHMVKKFLKNIQGKLQLKSSVGPGACFSFSVVCKNFSKDKAGAERISLENISEDILKRQDLISRASKMRVLVVEDDLVSQRVARYVFNPIVGHFDVASNGAEALSMIAANKYNCVFLDFGLPDISGVEIATKLKDMPDFSQSGCLVIGLTAHLSYNLDQPLEQKGFDCVLQKPITSEVALAACCGLLREDSIEKNKLKRRRGIKKDSAYLYRKYIDKLTRRKLENNNNKCLLDEEDPFGDAEDDYRKAAEPPLVEELRSLLIKDLPEDLSDMQDAYNQNNYDKLGSLVHRMHGATCYIRVPKLGGALKDLERVMQLHGEVGPVSEEYNKVVSEIKALLA